MENNTRQKAKLKPCSEIKVAYITSLDHYRSLKEFFKDKPGQEIDVSDFYSKVGLVISRVVEEATSSCFDNYHERDRWVPIYAYCGLISVLCTDERSVFSKVTYESALRAYKALHIEHSHYFVNVIHSLMEDNKHYFIQAFYGFLSDEKTAQLFDEPDQWLLRMDENGFKITVADSINTDTKTAIIRDYRIIESCGSYVLNNKKIKSLIEIVDHFPMELAVKSSPFYATCYSYVRRKYRDYSITGAWAQIVQEENKNYEHSNRIYAVKWLRTMYPNLDIKLFYEQCFGMAVNCEPSEAISLLTECLQHGADINHPMYAPIIRLVRQSSDRDGRIDAIADFLWNNGADPNIRDFEGYPAFWYAASNHNTDMAERLVRAFLRHPKLDVNITTSRGTGNVLCWAGSSVPQAVLDHPDVNINYVSDDRSLLDSAFLEHNYSHIKRLILRGADVTRQWQQRVSYYHMLFEPKPSHVTNQLSTEDIIELLANAGSDVNALDKSNQTPLHAAAHHGEPGWVLKLLEKGANVNGSRESETTPLYLAAERGHVEITKILLEHGADVTIRNSAGKLPEEVASFSTKELFEEPMAALPDFEFTGECVAITLGDSMPFPRSHANCFIVGDYLYVQGGTCSKYDHDDEYGYITVQLFMEQVHSFWRINITGNGPRKWEFITIPKMIWFYGSSGTFIEFDCNSLTWTDIAVNHHAQFNTHNKQYAFDYGDRIIIPHHERLRYIEKKTNNLVQPRMEQGDFVPEQYSQATYALAGNTIWCKSFWTKAVIYALPIEKHRWFKACIIQEMRVASAIAIFGNRFLIAIGHDAEAQHSLVVLDTESTKYSFHKISFDMSKRVTLSNGLIERNSGRTIDDYFNLQANDVAESKTKAENLITENGIFPYSNASLVISGSVLYIFGGSFESHLPSNELFTVNLSPLVPYITLEQQCAVTISNHKSSYSRSQLDSIPQDIKLKNNLGCLYQK